MMPAAWLGDGYDLRSVRRLDAPVTVASLLPGSPSCAGSGPCTLVARAGEYEVTISVRGGGSWTAWATAAPDARRFRILSFGDVFRSSSSADTQDGPVYWTDVDRSELPVPPLTRRGSWIPWAIAGAVGLGVVAVVVRRG